LNSNKPKAIQNFRHQTVAFQTVRQSTRCETEYQLSKRNVETDVRTENKKTTANTRIRRLTSSAQTVTTLSHGYVTAGKKVQSCWFGKRTL
jgi:hypothetical protein